MKLLLHACCGPCLCAPATHLLDEGVDLTAFWYNPNIHPYREYDHRRSTLMDFCRDNNLPLILGEDYDCNMFFGATSEADRCPVCYRLRLRATAKAAAENGFDAFSTTLLYSIYQNHELICEIAGQAAAELGVDFYYRDFRPLWREGVELSRNTNMYRQPYCGCIYSEKERYYKPLEATRV